MISTIRLDKLIASPRNVRRGSDPQADARLKADIAARGILQNLVVTAVKKPRGCFAVEAGERRRRALQALADEGAIARDLEVACLVIDDLGDAREASLAENFQRLSMNPADECTAFGALIEQGGDAETIARRFGLTVRFVEGRLRLATLAPEIFAALGAGEISLDVAKAYAATADRERQSWVFGQVGRAYAGSQPDSIRRLITQATASAGDRRALLVGEEAYVGAGGRVERDLFSDGAAARWLDVALLERLAAEKMAALASEKAAETGLAFVRPCLNGWVTHEEVGALRRVQVARAPLDEAEAARADGIEAEMDAIAGRFEVEEMDEEACAAAEERLAALARERDAIFDRAPLLDDDEKAALGTFLVLGDDGRPHLDQAYYSQERDEDPVARDMVVDKGEAHELPRKAGLSQRLVDELAIQRRDILAVHVANDPAFALDLAIFLMVDRAAGWSSERKGSSLGAPRPSDPVHDFRTPDAAATLARDELDKALVRTWTEGDSLAGRFDAFRALADHERADWLAMAVSGTLEASLNQADDRACAFHAHLGRLLGIDVARWWRPTGINYFDRVSKSLALAALADVGGEVLAARYARSKKAELSQACERIFAGDFIAEVEVKDAALAWIPDAMRFSDDTSGPGDDGNGRLRPEPEPPEQRACDAPDPSVDEAA